MEPINKKGGAFGSVKKYFAQCDAMHEMKIQTFRSANGGEFSSHAVEEFLASSQYKHVVSAACWQQ